MASDDVKSDRLYTPDHEWAKTVNGNVVIGLCPYAVGELGDITLVNIDVRAGNDITAGEAFGTIESVKISADLFAPVSGQIVRVNSAIETSPELFSEDCYGEAWFIEIKPSDPEELRHLFTADRYADYLKTL